MRHQMSNVLFPSLLPVLGLPGWDFWDKPGSKSGCQQVCHSMHKFLNEKLQALRSLQLRVVRCGDFVLPICLGLHNFKACSRASCHTGHSLGAKHAITNYIQYNMYTYTYFGRLFAFSASIPIVALWHFLMISRWMFTMAVRRETMQIVVRFDETEALTGCCRVAKNMQKHHSHAHKKGIFCLAVGVQWGLLCFYMSHLAQAVQWREHWFWKSL